MRLERRANALGEDAATAQRDHRTGLGGVEQLADELLLGVAKGGLAVQLELLGGRVAEPRREQLVAIAGARAELPRQLGGERRLAGAHEADQHERAPRGAC